MTETIYRYVWDDRAWGADLAGHLRCAQKKRRKRYGRYDSRGRLAGKRPISERPASVERRRGIGHWESDTMVGAEDGACPWERGTNENTNGLVRQYLPKRTSMEELTQRDCDRIAKKLNTRPRKRYDFESPEERFLDT